MGRYDKIKVYNGTEFVQPSRIRIFDGTAWQDLGANDSDIQIPLNVHNGTDFVRATLNKTQVTVPGESYAAGNGFIILPKGSFCFCPNSGSLTNAAWAFKATIRKTSNTALTIFNFAVSGSSYIKGVWNADGTITISGRYSTNTAKTLTTSNKVTANTWATLEVTCPKGSSTMSIKFGVAGGTLTTKTGSMGFNFQSSNCVNNVGSTGMQFKGNLTVSGSKYSNSSASKTINMSTASGTTSNYESVEHVDTTTTQTQWL